MSHISEASVHHSRRRHPKVLARPLSCAAEYLNADRGGSSSTGDTSASPTASTCLSSIRKLLDQSHIPTVGSFEAAWRRADATDMRGAQHMTGTRQRSQGRTDSVLHACCTRYMGCGDAATAVSLCANEIGRFRTESAAPSYTACDVVYNGSAPVPRPLLCYLEIHKMLVTMSGSSCRHDHLLRLRLYLWTSSLYATSRNAKPCPHRDSAGQR
jgi:hypothetical protein